jgi:hypothetical protein
MRKFAIGLMIGLLAFSSPAFAQQNSPPAPPAPPPFICDPQENPEPRGQAPCFLLVGSAVALMAILIAEGTRKHARPAPVSP